jgi:hypothetical protein
MLGNQVGSFLVTLVGQQSMAERAALVKEQMRSGFERFDRRQMGFSIWLSTWFTYLGPHLLAYGLTQMQRKLKLPRISCYATNIGNLTAELNRPDDRIKVLDFLGYGPSGYLLHGICEINDRVNLPLVWPRCEASDAEMDEYLRRLDEAFERVLLEGNKLERRRSGH